MKTIRPVRPARPADSTASVAATPAVTPNAGAAPGGPGGFGGAANRPRRASTGTRPGSFALVWTVDAEGTLTAHPVKIGISDGQRTEITSKDLKPGENIVIAATAPGADASTSPTTTNPLQPTQTRRGPPGPF